MPQLIHATFKSRWPSIERCGIKPRQYSHFVTSIPNKGEIIPGMNKECDTFIYLTDDVFDHYTFEEYETGFYRTKDRIDPIHFKNVIFVPQN
jgi:hypothetical protein